MVRKEYKHMMERPKINIKKKLVVKRIHRMAQNFRHDGKNNRSAPCPIIKMTKKHIPLGTIN